MWMWPRVAFTRVPSRERYSSADTSFGWAVIWKLNSKFKINDVNTRFADRNLHRKKRLRVPVNQKVCKEEILESVSDRDRHRSGGRSRLTRCTMLRSCRNVTPYKFIAVSTALHSIQNAITSNICNSISRISPTEFCGHDLQASSNRPPILGDTPKIISSNANSLISGRQ